MTINPNIRPSDLATLLDGIHAISQAAGTATTGWIDMQTFGALLCIVDAGVLGASATVDAKLQQATDSDGTGAKNLTGKAITQLTKAGTDDSKWVAINLFASELDASNDFRYVQLSVTVATAASLISALVMGFDANYGPGTANTSLDEVV